MDDEGDDWGDVLAGFDIGDLSAAQRQSLSDDLAEAGILHAYIGPELQGPASETEQIEHLLAQARRGGRRRRASSSTSASEPIPTVPTPPGTRPRALRRPFGDVPFAALALPISARWRRFAAYLVEAMGLGLVSAVIFRYSVGGSQLFAALAVVVSSVVLVALVGATVGMLVLQMRVVVLADPDRPAPGWSLALARYLVAWWPEALLMVLLPFVDVERLAWLGSIGNIWIVICFGPILLDPARRGLHDRVTGTVVVDVPRQRRLR